MCLCCVNVWVFCGDRQVIRVAVQFYVGGRGGRSCRKRLNRAGERVDPCGTPLCMCRVLDSLPSSFTWADLPERKLASHLL